MSIRTEHWLFETECPFHFTDHNPGLFDTISIRLLNEFHRCTRIHHNSEKILITDECVLSILKTDNERTTTSTLNLERELEFVISHKIKRRLVYHSCIFRWFLQDESCFHKHEFWWFQCSFSAHACRALQL